MLAAGTLSASASDAAAPLQTPAASTAADAPAEEPEADSQFADEEPHQIQQPQQLDDAPALPEASLEPSITPPPEPEASPAPEPPPPPSELQSMAEAANARVDDYEHRGAVRYMEANFHQDALRGDTVDPVYGRQEVEERSLYDSALEVVLEKHT